MKRADSTLPHLERFTLDVEQFWIDAFEDDGELFIHVGCGYCDWESPGAIGAELSLLLAEAMTHAVTCNRIPAEVRAAIESGRAR